ncbi:hypothetical protein WN51_09839 [Melipona quadrifasciata]|uniref:Uncharacterized protein n=1 Tax=Melipona quadrifasciata TaxID=166423 RepID=A0A0M9A597_9HYME|nr:hypothetical protein WN51_09839 [Melipona quadrifasciata]
MLKRRKVTDQKKEKKSSSNKQFPCYLRKNRRPLAWIISDLELNLRIYRKENIYYIDLLTSLFDPLSRVLIVVKGEAKYVPSGEKRSTMVERDEITMLLHRDFELQIFDSELQKFLKMLSAVLWVHRKCVSNVNYHHDLKIVMQSPIFEESQSKLQIHVFQGATYFRTTQKISSERIAYKTSIVTSSPIVVNFVVRYEISNYIMNFVVRYENLSSLSCKLSKDNLN